MLHPIEMSGKRIKNEQWTIKELISKINNKEIDKPKFQRKKKWEVLPNAKNDIIPNEKSYISFLYKTKHSVHPITFSEGHSSQSKRYSNIDGNNRINAIKHFIDKPFAIFKEYLYELSSYIDAIDMITPDDKEHLHEIFENISYNSIMNFKYNKYFIELGHQELHYRIKAYRNGIDDKVETIQTKLRISEEENFDTDVKITVNIFEGFTTEEMSTAFENMNKYISRLTETELLASRLSGVCGFEIDDKSFKIHLEESIKEYYDFKKVEEALPCYTFDSSIDKINAYDFITGLQHMCGKKYTFIDGNDTDGASLYFKMFNALYGGYDNTFTNKNVNDFKNKILYSCEMLQKTIDLIFTDKIDDKLFNKTCRDKIKSLKKNNTFVIFGSIIGYVNKKTDSSTIIKSLSKSLLYHFMLSDVKDKIRKDELSIVDTLLYKAGGAFIKTAVKNMLTDPEKISNKLKRETFVDLLNQLFNDVIEPSTEREDCQNSKRRQLKSFEKIIMFQYYAEKMPVNMLDNKFSIEHIAPISSKWNGALDKNRTGNLIPIISTMNSSRGNRHICEYSKTKEGKVFIEFIKDIIPDNKVYDAMMSHDIQPKIINNNLYNAMCEKNEAKYKQVFINWLFGRI